MSICNNCCHWRVCISCSINKKECNFFEAERPHGEWIPFTTIDGYTKHATCTNCGYKRKVSIGCSLDEHNLPKFCENCGADMRKEGDTNE